jgi:hypothetical protein
MKNKKDSLPKREQLDESRPDTPVAIAGVSVSAVSSDTSNSMMIPGNVTAL